MRASSGGMSGRTRSGSGSSPSRWKRIGVHLVPGLRGEDAGGQLEQRHAERVEVGAVVVVVLEQDLGRRVGEGAADAPVERAAQPRGPGRSPGS